ncbi:MAG: MFS transporter [Acidimicrobiales bacterium]
MPRHRRRPVPRPTAPLPEGTATPRRGLRAAAGALRHRNFALFWAGGLVSNVGRWLQAATIPYVVYQLTGSKTLIGVAAFAQFFPIVLMGPLAGSVADRFPRRSVLLWTQSAQAVLALALGAVWAWGWHDVGLLIAVVAVGGAVSGLNIPAWQAFVAELVPRSDLLNAVTLNSAQFNAARALGPALAGAVLATLGPAWAFLLNAVSYVAVLTALALVRVPRIAQGRSERRVLAQFADSLAYIRGFPEMVLCIVLVVAVAALGMPVFQLMPVFAADVFKVGEGAYGLLAGALGFGGAAAAPLVGGWAGGVRRSRVVGWSIAAYGLFLVAFAQSPGLLSAMVAIALAGMAYLAVVSTLNTTLQLAVAEERRGRVMAVYVMSFTAAYPLGSLALGWLAEQVGAPLTVSAAGLLLTGTAVVLWATAALHRFDRPTAVAGTVAGAVDGAEPAPRPLAAG